MFRLIGGEGTSTVHRIFHRITNPPKAGRPPPTSVPLNCPQMRRPKSPSPYARICNRRKYKPPTHPKIAAGFQKSSLNWPWIPFWEERRRWGSTSYHTWVSSKNWRRYRSCWGWPRQATKSYKTAMLRLKRNKMRSRLTRILVKFVHQSSLTQQKISKIGRGVSPFSRSKILTCPRTKSLYRSRRASKDLTFKWLKRNHSLSTFLNVLRLASTLKTLKS
jgi:hypothetical protein